MATFDWLGDIFGDDTFQTIVNGVNNAGSIFNSMSPLINRGAQLALGVNGTLNAAQFREANQNTLNSLNDMFSPTGDYAKELRNQLERKDAAAGRRSQYGTRETELMTNLAKQKAAVLTSPAYQNYLARANMSQYAPIAGAIGNMTNGGTTGQQGQQGRSGNTIPSGYSSIGQYISNLFGPGSEASVASLGGAGSALAGANSPASLGVVDSLGSMLGGSPYLPGYADTASGLFGTSPIAGQASNGGALGLTGDAIGATGDWLGAQLGGAGASLSGMGSGSLAGTVGGADTLGSMFGGTGFLPGYTSTTGASGLFGGAGAAGAGAGEAAAGAGAAGGGAGTAAAGAAPWGAAAATALPFAAAAYGMLGGLFGWSDDYDPRSQQEIARTTYGNLKDYLNNNQNLPIYRGWSGGDLSQINAQDLGSSLEDYMARRGINAGAQGYMNADYENALRGGGNLYAMAQMPGMENARYDTNTSSGG